jgi:hypothetical protein
MKLRALIVSAVVAGSSLLAIAPAEAGGEFCYNVHVVANGGDVINQAGCQPLP